MLIYIPAIIRAGQIYLQMRRVKVTRELDHPLRVQAVEGYQSVRLADPFDGAISVVIACENIKVEIVALLIVNIDYLLVGLLCWPLPYANVHRDEAVWP